MVNRHRGETALLVAGETLPMRLTLGALAELENAFAVDSLPALGERFVEGRLSARDIIRIIAAGLRGAGRAIRDEAYAGEAKYVQTGVADALGDADLAVAALRRELEAEPGFGEGTMAQYSHVAFWNAPYSGLRAHPGFKALLVQAGIVDYWRQTGRWGDGCAPLGAQDFQCR